MNGSVVLLAAILLVTGVRAAERPRVVETVPDSNDVAVDPTQAELRITFDQPMAIRGGYSIVGGGPPFPEITGEPEWVSDTVLTVPIRLQPDHAYRLSINSDRFQNFRGVNGLAAVPYPIEFRTAPVETAVALTVEQNRESIRRLRDAVDRRYSHRDLRKVDWDEVFMRFEPQLLAASTPGSFGTLTARMLGVAQDVHIWVRAGEETFASYQRNVRPNVNPALLPTVVPGFRQINPVVATGRFPGGPAYLMITSWERQYADDLKAAAEFIDQLDVEATLIIDVRLNSGGDELLAREIAGRFVEAPIVYAHHKYRDPDTEGGFSEIMDRVLSPTSAGKHFGGRIAVLMGPANMSSGEAFLLMMKQVPNCTLMGERSYGSSGNPRPVELANGVVLFLPSWVAMTAEGESFEGVGIEPGLEIDWQRANSGRDLVVERAIQVLSR